MLPFANISEQRSTKEHFADGISNDLITGLSRIRWLFVIARNSSFVYKNRAIDMKRIARELGVRYVLEGSVRVAGSRLRINAQLVDAMTGGNHWAERYDREIGDIFAMQDEITRSVAGAIEPRLLAAEGVRALSRSADGLGAWELVARAQTQFWRMTRAGLRRSPSARSEKRAVTQGYPDYAPARGMLGLRLAFASHMGWIARDEGLRAAREHALRAIALDDRDPWGHSALGYWAMMERRTRRGVDRGLSPRWVDLNLANSAAAHTNLSHTSSPLLRAASRSDRAW